MQKLLKLIGMLVIATFVLAACGGETPTATPVAPTTAPAAAATNTTAPAAPAATDTAAMAGPTNTAGSTSGSTLPKVTGNLTVWESYGSSHGSAESDAWTQALAQFQKDNPDAKVTALDVPFDQIFNKFETEAAAGGGPDLYIAPNDSLGKEVRAGLLMPLDQQLAGKLTNDLDVAVNASKVDGKLYEVPESLKAVAAFYNTKTLANPPKTTDELLAGVKAGTIKAGLNQSAYHNWGFFNAFGGQVFDTSGVCTADTGLSDAYKYLQDLKAAGAQFFTDGSKLSQAFEDGSLNYTIDGPWLTGDYKKALGADLGVVAMPDGPKGHSAPLTAPDGWYINANTQATDQAVNFALYMTSPQIEQIWVDVAGHIPADKTIKITDPIIQGFATAYATGDPRPQTAVLDNYWTPFGDALNKVMDTGAAPVQAIADACAATNKANNKTGGSSAPAATDTPAAGSSAAPPPKVTGNLTVWESYGSSHGSAESDAWTQALAQFQKDNPDAKVTALDVPFDQIFNKFETEAAAGGGPDLYIAPNDSLGKEVRAGLLMPLDQQLAGKLTNDLDVAVNASKVDGKLYEVPESLKAVAAFYNTKTLANPPKTTDELLAGVKAGTIKAGLNQSAYHNWGFFNAFGGQVFDTSGKCTADTGLSDAYKYLQDLKAAGAQFFTDGSKLSQAFEDGSLNYTIDGPWLTGDYKKALGADLGVVAMPDGPKGHSAPLTAPDGWYINANTQATDQAVNFALYMTSPQIEQIWVDVAGHIPADKTIKITDPIIQGFATAYATGDPRPQTAVLDNYWTPFGDALNKVMDTGAAPVQAIADACAATNKANNK